MTQTLVYLGLGSNLDQPLKQLQQALSQLHEHPAMNLVKSSQFYASRPLGPQDQPDFVNAVAAIQTSLQPLELLAELKKMEAEQGRIKKRHWGERLIDLDILYYGDAQVNLPNLQIPHAEIANRDFVLLPLAEIAPDLVIPNLGKVTDLITHLKETFVIPIQGIHE